LRQIFQSADFFIGYSNYKRFLFRPEAGGPLDIARVLIVHSMVLPDLGSRSDPKWGQVLSVQHSPMATATGWALAATVCWISLLALGAAGLRHAPRSLRITVTGFLAWQLGLHAFFGEESFLYSLHVLPALILIASFAVWTRARVLALALASVLAVTAAVNNIHQLRSAVAFLDHRLPASTPTNPPCMPTCYTPSLSPSGSR
jgi:hypothetical protein